MSTVFLIIGAVALVGLFCVLMGMRQVQKTRAEHRDETMRRD